MVALASSTSLPRRLREPLKTLSSTRNRRRFSRWRKHCTLQELSGSLGDLATLLPILVALSVSRQVDLSASLVFGGLWNILTGLKFGLPMCVQPMKAIAAVALSTDMSMPEIMGAGLFMGGTMLFLGATGLVSFVSDHIPVCIVKGIQLGTGLNLITKSVRLLLSAPTMLWFGPDWNWFDNYELALVSFLFAFSFYRAPRVPVALILFMIGLAIALVRVYTGYEKSDSMPKIGFRSFPVIVPTLDEFWSGTANAALAQLPLTLLNSVIAVTALVEELFPERSAGVTEVAVSVGLMNVIGCWFGAMPFCHGSGGIAGQYRFGARSEISIIFLGTCKMVVGFLFGSTLLSLLGSVPRSIISVMLFAAGTQLCCAFRGIETLPDNASSSRLSRWTKNAFDRMRKKRSLDLDADEANADLKNQDPTSSTNIRVSPSPPGSISSEESNSGDCSEDALLVGVVTAGCMLAFSHAGLGFLAGIAVHLLLKLQRRWEK